MKSMTSIIGITLLSLAVAQSAYARDFRSMVKIPVAPKHAVIDADMKEIMPTSSLKAVDSALIEKSIREIVASWNSKDLSQYLADSFQDKNLLLTTIDRSVPRDATLRVLSIQGISPIEQSWSTNKKTRVKQLQTVVIATVELQLEFNDPFNGLIRLPHTSQFYLQVTESEE